MSYVELLHQTLRGPPFCADFCNMPVVTLMVHPKGLHPLQAAKAWVKHREEGMSLNAIIGEGEVVNMEGNAPTLKSLWTAIQRVDASGQDQFAQKSNYQNCGRSKVLSEGDVKNIVSFSLCMARSTTSCLSKMCGPSAARSASGATIELQLSRWPISYSMQAKRVAMCSAA